VKGTVVAIRLNVGSRAPLEPADRATAVTGAGLQGDRHSRPGGRRQVLLVEEEVLGRLGLGPGAVREQITVRGVPLDSLTEGGRLRLGAAIVEVREMCEPCSRMDEIRSGLRVELEGRRGRFVHVVQGGDIAVGDPIEAL
jgi:MOSC domain-containing protein YiiM